MTETEVTDSNGHIFLANTATDNIKTFLERPNSLLLDHTKHCGTYVAVQKIARP
jgi:hypothetical protein